MAVKVIQNKVTGFKSFILFINRAKFSCLLFETKDLCLFTAGVPAPVCFGVQAV